MQPLLLQILIFLKKAGIMPNGLCMPSLIVFVIILLFVIFISFRFIVFVVINAREEVFRQRLIKFVELLVEVVLLLPCGDTKVPLTPQGMFLLSLPIPICFTIINIIVLVGHY